MKKILSMISMLALTLVMVCAVYTTEAQASGATDCTRAVYYVSTYEELKAACEATRYDRTIIFENDIIVGYDDLVSTGSDQNYMVDYEIDIKGDTTVAIDFRGYDYKVLSRNTVYLFDVTESASVYFMSTITSTTSVIMFDFNREPIHVDKNPFYTSSQVLHANTKGSVNLTNIQLLIGDYDWKESGTSGQYIDQGGATITVLVENAKEIHIDNTQIRNRYKAARGLQINTDTITNDYFEFTMATSTISAGKYPLFMLDASDATMRWSSMLESYTGDICFYGTNSVAKGSIGLVLGMDMLDGTSIIATDNLSTYAPLDTDEYLQNVKGKLYFTYPNGDYPSNMYKYHHDTSLILPHCHLFRMSCCGAIFGRGDHVLELDTDGYAYCKCGHEDKYEITLSQSSYEYDGTAKEPEVGIKMSQMPEGYYSSAYEVEYSNNTNIGTATVTVKAKEDSILKGTVTKTFNITPKKITPTIVLSNSTYTYNEQVQKPTVTVKNGSTVLPESVYTVTYPAGMKDAGTYKVNVTLKGNYSGSGSATYTIIPKKVTPVVSLSKTKYTYNGKVQMPTVTVKDGSAVLATANYTVTYPAGMKNVGSYNVTVTLKGNYSGSASQSFVINPKATTLKNVKAGKKKLTVTWKKLTSQTTGYEIQYSTSSKFKNAKKVVINKNKTTKTVIKKLKSKKTYYVRIRTYKTVKIDGKTTKLYSGWSAYKYAKVK